MSYWLSVYRANLKMAIANMLQYRFAILIWAVWGFVGAIDFAGGLVGGYGFAGRSRAERGERRGV